MDKPDWKLAAEIAGESLPDYWTMREVARLFDYQESYPYKACVKHRIPTIKIGQVRFIRDNDLSTLEEKFKK